VILTKEEFKRLKNRDPEIFKKLYLNYKLIVLNYLNIKTKGNSQIAEELFNEVFYSAFESVPGLKNQENLQGWIIKIAHNKYCDYIKSIYKKKRIEEKVKSQVIVQKESASIDTELMEKEKLTILKMALEKIEPEYRRILTLKYIENKKIKAIAAEFAKSNKAAESLLFRAKRALRRELKKISRVYFE
jgi:RNA polymerase sigma factor (sigma-70 family)